MSGDVVDSQISEMMAAWRQALAHGRAPTAATLCADCPEKAAELSRQMLAELLATWQDGQDHQQPIPLAELCRHCPEHLDELMRRIKALEFMHGKESVAGLTELVKLESQPADEFVFAVASYGNLQEIGMGGLAQVFRAYEDGLSRHVALKLMRADLAADPERRSRFAMEASQMAALQHPGVLPVYAVGQASDGRPFYSMPLMSGTLEGEIEKFYSPQSRRLNGHERLREFRKLLASFVSICETIHFAHQEGIVHCDLKPANVLVGEQGEVMLSDWGLLIRLQEDGMVDCSSTECGVVTDPRGTPIYMSPEQAVGRAELISRATDVYCLGATLYHILVGEPPISGTNLSEMIGRVITGDFHPPIKVKPDVSPALNAICMRAMAPKPKDRYATAREVGRDVENWLAYEPISVYRYPLSERVARWMRSRKLSKRLVRTVLLWLIAVILIAFAIGLSL